MTYQIDVPAERQAAAVAQAIDALLAPTGIPRCGATATRNR